ncbi:MAG: Hydrolase, alpha/beta hydrolase fold family [Alphaproteobacteria bacterium]|nr:Hydrolase, alpha/beta hydrolase fold family [Alphaproteobacteria bacterium]
MPRPFPAPASPRPLRQTVRWTARPAAGLLALLAAIAAAPAAAASPPPPGPVFVPHPCADAQVGRAGRCGTVRVPEDRARPGGRAIALNLIMLPATSPGPHLPPLFDIDGGPGLPDTKNAVFYLTDGPAYRARRDIVLVDQRGTGGSNPLPCPQLAAAEAGDAEMLPIAAVEACRRALAARADLRRYGTREAVADLDAVRAALGYERIDLFALSYGTTVALRYLATYPGRVRAALLWSVSPPAARPPLHHAEAGARALRLLFAECAAEAACKAAFPDPEGDFRQALRRLPAIAGAPPPAVFAERIRSLMYSPAGARRIPSILHQAAAGDLAPFHAATGGGGGVGSLLADGMFLSVTCAEGIGLIDYAPAAAAARATLFGDYRLRRQRDACRHWPKGAVAPGHLAPVSAPAAVLLISGRLDPVTPPEWAAEVAAHLPHSRQLIIPEGGHLIEGLSAAGGCFDALVIRFLDSADPAAVDGSCLAQMQPPAFAGTGGK